MRNKVSKATLYSLLSLRNNICLVDLQSIEIAFPNNPGQAVPRNDVKPLYQKQYIQIKILGLYLNQYSS
jgi:hypothetical protein